MSLTSTKQTLPSLKYNLETTLSANNTLKVLIKPTNLFLYPSSKTYQAIITEQMLSKCALSDFADLKQYLAENKDEDELNYKVDEKQMCFYVLAVSFVRGKKNLMELFKTNIVEVEVMKLEGKVQSQLLKQIIHKCKDNADLSNGQIKTILSYLAQNLLQKSVDDLSAQKQTIDSIVSKLVWMGHKQQGVQKKLRQFESLINQQKQSNEILNQTVQLSIEQMKYQLNNQSEQNMQNFNQIKQKVKQIEQLIFELKQKYHRNTQQEIQKMKQVIEKLRESVQNKFMDFDRKVIKSQTSLMFKLMSEIQQERTKRDILATKINDILNKKQETNRQIKSQEKIRKYKNEILKNESDEEQQEQQQKQQSEQQSSGQKVQGKISDQIKSFSIPHQQQPSYKVTGQKIKRIGSNTQITGITSNVPVLQQNSFKCKVIETQCWGINVGIKDILTDDTIVYGGNGWISNCGENIYGQGEGLNDGDIVEVTVDTEKSQIIWKVKCTNSEEDYTTKCTNAKISGKDTFWVPYINIEEDDMIQIL